MFLNEVTKFENFIQQDYKNIKIKSKLLSKKEISNLIKIYKNFNLNKKNIENYSENNIDNFNIDFLINNYNYSKKFLNQIKKLSKLNKIQYNFNDTEVDLDIYYDNKLNKKFSKEIVDLINFNIILFNKLHPKPRKNIKIYMFLTKFKKTISINKNNQLSADNINSGYTQSFSDSSYDYIVLYRTEEIKKVLVHELIHLYNLHTFQNYKTKINDLIKNTNNRFSIFEAYTETFATLIYSFYYLNSNKKYNKITKNGKDNKDVKNVKNNFNNELNELLNKQLLFSYLQSAKILYNQNILNIDNMKIINEQTNAVSYYILKCMILNNLNLFKNLFNNEQNYLLNTNKKVTTFDNYLLESYNNNKFQNNINKFILLLKNNASNDLNKKYEKIFKSFRMNILD